MFSAFLGDAPREDFIPYTADFFLQLEDVKWTIIAGIVGGSFIVSVRNLGYSRNAGEFVKRWFGDIGSAGGHRAMAKAVVPMRSFREKFGDLSGADLTARIADMAEQFLHEPSRRTRRGGEARPGSGLGLSLSSPRAFSAQPSLARALRQRLIQIGDQVVRVLQPDRQPRHALRHAGAAQLLVGVAPLRRQHRQAAQALDRRRGWRRA